MTGFSSLHTALSALSAQQRVLDVTGHNIANASTPGHHRQRVELAAISSGGVTARVAGVASGAGGVQVMGVTRSIDELLTARSVREGAALADARVTSSVLSRIEGAFPEPTDVGLAHQLDEFWSAWGDVAHQPGGLAARSQLLERASTLVASFNRTANDLAAVADQAQGQLNAVVSEVNELASRIAALNSSISANPSASLDLLDRRGLLVERLAELTGAESRPGAGGQIDITIGGRALVTGTVARGLTAVAGGAEWADGQAVVLNSGEARALAAVVNDVVPRHLGALNDVAAALVDRVNAVHENGVGQDGATGRSFFDPANLTAGGLRLSDDVVGQPAHIGAAAAGAGDLDGEVARALAGLADAADGPDARYRALVSTLAVETRAALRRTDIQGDVSAAARNDAEAVGAVSIDEEMVALVTAQRAFEAAARFMTVVDDLLATLIQRTGVVGR